MTRCFINPKKRRWEIKILPKDDWVTRKNKSLEEKDDPSTDFYHEKYEDTLRKWMWL